MDDKMIFALFMLGLTILGQFVAAEMSRKRDLKHRERHR
jgi:hypothetical protein